MSEARGHVPVRRYDGGQFNNSDDQVALEAPLEIRLRRAAEESSQSISITLRTPGHDAELALGFLAGEGLIRRPADVQALQVFSAGAGDAQGDVVELQLAAGVEPDLERLRRHFYATSSCGICGRASLEALSVLGHPPIDAQGFSISAARLLALPAALAERQSGFAATGGLHATAVFDADGQLGEVREDVGRHNATDKVIGAALQAQQLPLALHGLLFSGRVSFEIVQKALMAGCPLVAAVGAPSSLAIDLAWEFGLTLVGFLRDGRFNVYANPDRIRA